MSLPLFKLNDIFEVSPTKALTSLSKSEKHRFMDKILDASRADKRGLIVDFNLSSSGRRINNRIYTPTGQRAGVESWTQPFPKPIIRNHDKSEDPMGRFTSVLYADIDDQAMRFFKTAQDFMSFKDALESDDPRKIINAMKRSKLLTNKKWPGIGELVAKARISDEAAIEKFLDGRYMTFSAGSNTDRYVCSKCMCDWADGEHCDHRPGEITTDGDLVFFITGGFYGEEGSVLTNPANDYSSVRSLTFADSLNYTIPQSDCLTDLSTIYITDGAIDFSDKEESESYQENIMDPAQIDALLDALMPKLLEKLAKEKEDSKENVTSTDEVETTSEVADAPVLTVDWSSFDTAVAELKASLTDTRVEIVKEVTVEDTEAAQKLIDSEAKLT